MKQRTKEIRNLKIDGTTERQRCQNAYNRASPEIQRTYSSEHAGILLRPEGRYAIGRDILLQRHAALFRTRIESLHKTSTSNRSENPSLYIPTIPYGEDGCKYWITPRSVRTTGEKGSAAKVAPMMNYKQRLFLKPILFNTLLRGGRLFQQDLVNKHCKVEAEKLKLICKTERKASCCRLY